MSAAGWVLVLDGIAYDAHRDGRPFTLGDVWRESRGVRGCSIWQGDRRVLSDAGSLSQRHALWALLQAGRHGWRSDVETIARHIGHTRAPRRPLP